jgi:hypothetical protein
MLDNGMSTYLAAGMFGGHSVDLAYVVLNGEHCWLTPERPIWGNNGVNPTPNGAQQGQLAGSMPLPAATWQVPNLNFNLDSNCYDYDIWPWGCGDFLTDNPRRQAALNWLKYRFNFSPLYPAFTQRQTIAMQYMAQKVYHFQQMGDDDIDAVNCRLSQMGRSVWERFQNFRDSFYRTNINPFMSQNEATAWANERFIGFDTMRPNQTTKFHDPWFMFAQPEVLQVMGLIP